MIKIVLIFLSFVAFSQATKQAQENQPVEYYRKTSETIDGQTVESESYHFNVQSRNGKTFINGVEVDGTTSLGPLSRALIDTAGSTTAAMLGILTFLFVFGLFVFIFGLFMIPVILMVMGVALLFILPGVAPFVFLCAGIYFLFRNKKTQPNEVQP